MKENDYFLNLLANPDFSPRDFANVGLNMENTSFEDKQVYKEIEQIRNNPMFLTNGKFDESKLDNIYNMASQSFKVFSDEDLLNKVANDPVFYKHDIFADRDKRIYEKEFAITKTINPLRKRTGLMGQNDVHESLLSVRENALKELVYDGATDSWLEAPNDAFWKNFSNTLVLAQYDEDVYDSLGNLIHQKGEKKLNENGTYYYETLNGRDIYGREVLSKFDTLTVDGSAWNKFDFFDSDDKKKKTVGTLVKNVIKVAPAFIPGVSQWYIGARMAMNLTELMAKMGKVFTGSDNPTLSAIEGFVESLSFSSSDYARGSLEAEKAPHIWSLENIINMGGDVFLQLAEQRWLFERGPALFKGKAGYSDEAAKAMQDDWTKALNAETEALKLKNIQKHGWPAFNEMKKSADAINIDNLMNAYMKSYRTIGEHMSRAYMTGIVAAEAYGDAKAEGLSDGEAAALTLGYALFEYGLLSTDIGKWVLPELSKTKNQFRQMTRKLLTDPKNTQPPITASNAEKANWLKRLVLQGKKFALSVHDPTVSVVKSSVAGALAEGVEEVSEEFLYDISKSLFNLSAYLRDSDSRMDAFKDVFDRYALSFVGGAMGGGLMTVRSDFKEAKQVANMTASDAYQMLVHIVDLGEDAEFMKTASKMILASPDLAADNPVIDGVEIYKSGNPQNNKNKAAIDALQNEVNMIKLVLNANGGTISDESLMNLLTNADKKFRLVALQKSNFMPLYLLNFNTLQTLILEKHAEIEAEYKKLKDYPGKDSSLNSDPKYKELEETVNKTVSEKKKELKKLVELKESILKGEQNSSYIERAAFEMMGEVSDVFITSSLPQYALHVTGKKLNQLTKDEIKDIEKEWLDYKTSGYKDDLERAFRIFKNVNTEASDLLTNFVKTYLEDKDNTYQSLLHILSGSTAQAAKTEDLDMVSSLGSLKILPTKQFQGFSVKSQLLNLLAAKYGRLVEDVSGLEADEQNQKITNALLDLLSEEKVMNSLLDEFKKASFFTEPEKQFLLKALGQLHAESSIKGNAYLTNSLAELKRTVEKKPHTPIIELLDAWNVKTGAKQTTSQLIQFLENTLMDASYDGKVKEVTLNEDLESLIEEALSNIEIFKGAILAARTDNVSEFNIIGYNHLINDINPEAKLATIDKNSANVLLQEINTIQNTLNYFRRLNALNTGLKLEEENNLDTKFTYLLYDAFNSYLKRLLTNAPDDEIVKKWKGVEELKLAFSKLQILGDSKFDRTQLKLSDEQRIQLKKDKIAMEDAIYDFFSKNEDSDLEELLTSIGFNLTQPDTGTLDIEMDKVSANRFIFWLAAKASLKASDFHKLYYNTIPSDLAPLVGQENAIFMGYAFLKNQPLFERFAKAFNKVLAEQGHTYAPDIIDLLDSRTSIDFVRTVLLDGIAGAGKTSAVIRSIVALLQNTPSAKHVLENVWFVAPTKERAAKLAEDCGFKVDDEFFKNNCFSREEVLVKIAPTYKPYPIDEDGNMVVNPENVKMDGNFVKWNYGLNKAIKAPSMMIMDEVTGFSQQDMFLIDDFSKMANIANIAAGDFDLATLHGYGNEENGFITIGNERFPLSATLYAGNFIGTWKLGTSMRAASKLIDYNNKLLRANLKSLKTENKTVNDSQLSFKYYEDDLQVLGYKNVGDDLYSEDEIKTSIKKWLDTGNKVGFIYDDASAPLYNLMMELNEEYPNKIDMRPGNTSQGEELDFYVLSLSEPSENPESYLKYWETAYTGFTRAKKGVIFDIKNSDVVTESTPSNDIGEYSLGLKSIQNFTEHYRKILKGALEDTELPEIQFSKGNTPKNTPSIQNTPEEAPVAVGISFNLDDEIYTIIGYDNGNILYKKYEDLDEPAAPTMSESISEFLKKEITYISNMDNSNFETQKQNSDIIPVDNTNTNLLNMILHANATKETGVIIDELGYIHEINPDRLDSINGLLRILNIPISTLEKPGNNRFTKPLLDALDLIRAAALHSESAVELNNSIKNIITNLVLNVFVLPDFDYSILDNLRFDHMIKTSELAEDEASTIKMLNAVKSGRKHPKFFKSIVEKLRGIFSKEERAEQVNNRTLSLYVTDANGKELFELPLLMMTHPLNLLNTPGFEGIKNWVESNCSSRESNFEKLLKLEKHLKTLSNANSLSSLSGFELGENLLKLIQFYRKTDDNVVFLHKYNKTLSEIFTKLGPVLSTKPRGNVHRFTGEMISIQEYADKSQNVVSPIMSALIDHTDESGNVLILAGKPFILISDDVYNITLDNILQEYIESNGKNKKIKRLYITPPTADLKSFVENLQNIYNSKNGENKLNAIAKSMGNELSVFRLLEMFIKDPNETFVKQIFEDVPNTVKEDVKKAVEEKYNKVKAVIEALSEIKDMKKFLEVYRQGNTIKTKNGDVNLKDIGKGKSWKSALAYYFLQQMTDPFASSLKGNKKYIKKSKLESLEAVIKDKWDGIFYHIPLKKGSEVMFQKFKQMLYEDGYKFQGKDIMMNGKVDDTSFIADILSIIDGDHTEDIKAYEEDTHLQDGTKRYVDDLFKEIDSLIEDYIISGIDRGDIATLAVINSALSREEILQALQNHGFITLSINGLNIIHKLDEGLSWDGTVLTDLTGRKYTLTLANDNKIELLEIISLENSEEPDTELGQVLTNSLEETISYLTTVMLDLVSENSDENITNLSQKLIERMLDNKELFDLENYEKIINILNQNPVEGIKALLDYINNYMMGITDIFNGVPVQITDNFGIQVDNTNSCSITFNLI